MGKFIVAKGFKTCPKFNKSPNLVTLDLCVTLADGRSSLNNERGRGEGGDGRGKGGVGE